MKNREIKFRVWVSTGMAEGRTIQDITTIKIPAGTKIESVYYPDDAIFMQYTGLKDKNGKEIYELHEINNEFRIVYKFNRFILQSIENISIFKEILEDEQYEITGEYSPLA